MARRHCTYNEKLQAKYPSFIKGKTDYSVKCLICDSTLSIANKGSSDLSDHLATII